MAPSSATSARRGRRLLAAILASVSLVAAVSTLRTAPARAADPNAPAAKATHSPTASPIIELSPTPSPTPTCDFFSTDPACLPPSPSPSPSVIVVSPVPDTPSPTPTTPSYLQGAEPTPSPRIGDTVSSPVPLGGGFVDQLPTPSSGPPAPTGSLAPHQSGLPLPFLAVGALLILGALGSLIYAVAPRDRNVFAAPRRRTPASPVMFTPYGPDTPGTNILSGGKTGTPGTPPRPPQRP